jgi:predicted transcriptional regulator
MNGEYLNETEKKVLELETRRRLYDVVKQHAGCHFREIERMSQLSTGSATYHLHYLVKKGLLEEVRDRKNKRYFTKEVPSKNKKLLSLLRQKSIRRIMLCLLINKKCNHETLSTFAQLSPSTTSWHMQKLEQEHIVGFVKLGRKKYFTLLIDKNEIMNLLITYQQSFVDTLVDNVIEMWGS